MNRRDTEGPTLPKVLQPLWYQINNGQEIVGHNPGLEELVEQLTGEWQDLPTAALAQVVLPIDRWRDLTSSTRGTLKGHWRPKELP